MSEQGIDVNQKTMWAHWCNSYEWQPLTKWQRVKSIIPWRLTCLLRWLWWGNDRYSVTSYVIWNGPPPCRLARLWRRP